MARALADAGSDAIFSYAGRTAAPIAQPLPTRVGGFGGVAGLRDWLQAQRITHLVDATHPFAAQMSSNAVYACAAAGVPLFMHGREITSLSFTALGIGLVVFALMLAAAALVMLFRPGGIFGRWEFSLTRLLDRLAHPKAKAKKGA